MKRNLRKLVLFLLLGAIVNVAVAWGCAIRSTPKTWDEREIDDHDRRWLQINGEQAEYFEETNGVEWQTATLSRGIGVTWETFDLYDSGFREAQRRFAIEYPGAMASWIDYEVICVRSGWPFRSLSSERWVHTKDWTDKIASSDSDVTVELTGGWLFDDSTLPRFISYQPIWPGFAINTIFYAAILWMLFAVPGRVRRWRRSKRGLCPACAYPVGQSATCTECGAAVQSVID